MPGTQGTNAGDAAGGTGGSSPFRVFTTEDEFKAEINAAEARARNIAEREARKRQAVPPEELEELDRLRKADADRQQKDAEAKGEWDRLKQQLLADNEKAIAAERGKVDKAAGELRVERIRRALVSAAAKHGAIDPEEVADLLERRCRLDDNYAVEVLDEAGKHAYGPKGDDLTPEQLVDGYLGKKPHLVRAGSTGQGGGSRGGASVSGDAADAGLTPSVAAAKTAWDEADTRAKASGSNEDNAIAWKFKRAYDQAVKDATRR